MGEGHISKSGPVLLSILLALLLGGCAGWPFGGGVPQPLPTRAGYSGSDGAFIHVRAVDVGCCYIEGSLHFAQLEGPTGMTWQVNPWSYHRLAIDSGYFEDGPIGISSGAYTVTFWQRPCDGNCDNLDPEVTRCSASFDAGTGDELLVEARFPLEGECSVTVSPQ